MIKLNDPKVTIFSTSLPQKIFISTTVENLIFRIREHANESNGHKKAKYTNWVIIFVTAADECVFVFAIFFN